MTFRDFAFSRLCDFGISPFHLFAFFVSEIIYSSMRIKQTWLKQNIFFKQYGIEIQYSSLTWLGPSSAKFYMHLLLELNRKVKIFFRDTSNQLQNKCLYFQSYLFGNRLHLNSVCWLYTDIYQMHHLVYMMYRPQHIDLRQNQWRRKLHPR